uniref:Uncharacterized protein n=1 Tax=Oryza punctata TaxID=4537 RepID=A0A0E0MFB3_ORYPU
MATSSARSPYSLIRGTGSRQGTVSDDGHNEDSTMALTPKFILPFSELSLFAQIWRLAGGSSRSGGSSVGVACGRQNQAELKGDAQHRTLPVMPFFSFQDTFDMNNIIE